MFYLENIYFEEMVSHARKESPNECCGLVAGKNGRITKLYPATNTEHSPIRYSVEPNELIKIYLEIEAQGWDLFGIYHSHVNHKAYPSAVDVKNAFFPESLYIIISVNDSARPVIRAFTIDKGEITEQEFQVI